MILKNHRFLVDFGMFLASIFDVFGGLWGENSPKTPPKYPEPFQDGLQTPKILPKSYQNQTQINQKLT